MSARLAPPQLVAAGFQTCRTPLRALALLLPAALLAFAACGGDDDDVDGLGEPSPASGGAETLEVTSAAFQEGGDIPPEFTCQGSDRPLPVAWDGVPEDTESLALVLDDPEVGYAHWLVYAIPPDASGLGTLIPQGALEGTNSARGTGYTGPCPPQGEEHTYRVRLFALDTVPALETGAAAKDLLGAMDGHVIAQGELTGTYQLIVAETSSPMATD